jgi:type I restriction enzyme S subunit
VNWPVVALAEAAKIARVGVAPEDIIAGTTYVGLENMDGLGDFVGVSGVDAGELGSTKFRFSKDQVLFGKLRPYLKKTARPSFDGVCSTDILPLSPAKHVDRDYLFHVLRRQSFVDEVTSLCVGANLPRISPAVLGAMLIPLPPLPEQRRIATILDKADALRVKRREAIAKFDQLLQAVFLDMFGDPAMNPNGWPIGRLADLGELDRGVSRHRPRGAPELLGGDHPLLQTGDVARSGGYIREFTATYSDVGLAQSKKWPAGTLCITIAANIADTGILTFDACFPDSVVGFTPGQSSNVEFVQALLGFLRKILEERAPQVAQKNINLAILRELPIPIPPVNLQRKWASFAAQVESMKQGLRVVEECGHKLFASVQRKAFTGTL